MEPRRSGQFCKAQPRQFQMLGQMICYDPVTAFSTTASRISNFNTSVSTQPVICRFTRPETSRKNHSGLYSDVQRLAGEPPSQSVWEIDKKSGNGQHVLEASTLASPTDFHWTTRHARFRPLQMSHLILHFPVCTWGSESQSQPLPDRPTTLDTPEQPRAGPCCQAADTCHTVLSQKHVQWWENGAGRRFVVQQLQGLT